MKANVEPLQGELRYERFGTTSIAAVSILTWLVWCLAEQGAFAEGSVCAEEAVRIAEATDYPRSYIQVYFGVGMLHLRKGDLHQAIPVLERGLSICQRVDILGWFVDIGPVLDAAYLRSGRVAEALPLLEQAVERAASMRHMLWHSLRVCWLSEAYLLTGRMDEAIRLAEHALKHAQDRQERGYQAWALRLPGEIYSHQDSQEFGQAETSYHQALALAEELGMRPLVAHCRLGLGTLYGQLGQLAQAGSELSAAIELYRDMEMTFWLTRTEAALTALPPD